MYCPGDSIHQNILTLSLLTESNFNALLTLQEKNRDKCYWTQRFLVVRGRIGNFKGIFYYCRGFLMLYKKTKLTPSK